jgi:hypothetical protein
MHKWRKRSTRATQLLLLISWTIATWLVAPCSSAEIYESDAVALEKLADEQFAAHDVDCVENYRDAIFAWSKTDKTSSDRLRVTEKLCRALTYDRAQNAMTCDFQTTEVADDIAAAGAAPTGDIAKLISILNCSDGFSAGAPVHHITGLLDVLRQVSHVDLNESKDQKACLEKLVLAVQGTDNLPLIFSALKVIADAPSSNSSITQDVRYKLESSIASINKDSPEFSLLTPAQRKIIHQCKVSTLERSLKSQLSPESMADVILQTPVAERNRLLQILLKQEPSYDPNNTERELALGWCCDLTGQHRLASKYYSNALSRIKRIISECKTPVPNLVSTQCLAQLSLVCSYLTDKRLNEAQSNLAELKPLITALPEAHSNGFREFVLPLEGEIAWKAGRLPEAENLLQKANEKFVALPPNGELSMFLRWRPALKILLPGEEKTLSSLIEVLKLEHKYSEAEKKTSELKALQNSVQKSDQLDKFQRLPWFPGSRDPAYAKFVAPAYLKALDTVYQSEDSRLLALDSLAQKTIDASLFETARIFVDTALLRLANKTDERAQSFRRLFLLKQIRIDVETWKLKDALTEVESFKQLVQPTNKDTQLELLDVKGWHARILLYERKFPEAQVILESIYPECKNVSRVSELADHQRDHVLDLARLYLAKKNYDAAESILRVYLKELGSVATDAQFNYAQILLANLYAKKNHVGLANTLINESVEQSNRFFAESTNLNAAYAMFALGDFYNDRGNNIRAERYNARGNDILNYLGLEKSFHLQ